MFYRATWRYVAVIVTAVRTSIPVGLPNQLGPWIRVAHTVVCPEFGWTREGAFAFVTAFRRVSIWRNMLQYCSRTPGEQPGPEIDPWLFCRQFCLATPSTRWSRLLNQENVRKKTRAGCGWCVTAHACSVSAPSFFLVCIPYPSQLALQQHSFLNHHGSILWRESKRFKHEIHLNSEE
jgi:hypothetical protein